MRHSRSPTGDCQGRPDSLRAARGTACFVFLSGCILAPLRESTPCTSTLDCADDQICTDGGCTKNLLSAVACEPACNDGERCISGECICDPKKCGGCCKDARCFASANDTCGLGGAECATCSGETNNCSAGVCVGPCSETVPCDGGCCNGGLCHSGLAAEACGAPLSLCIDCVGADAGSACRAGTCGCVTSADCPVGLACPAGGGVCGTICADDAPCNGGCCAGGQCSQGLADTSCGEDGAACKSCGALFCAATAKGGACACMQSSDCIGKAEGSTCVSAQMSGVPSVCGCVTEADCPSQRACVAGKCSVTGCSAESPCQSGCCDNGTCVSIDGCSGDRACATNRTCPQSCAPAAGGNYCVSGCCNGATGTCEPGSASDACGNGGLCANCSLNARLCSSTMPFTCECGAGTCTATQVCTPAGDCAECGTSPCPPTKPFCDSAGTKRCQPCTSDPTVCSGGTTFCQQNGACAATCDAARQNANGTNQSCIEEFGAAKQYCASGACKECTSDTHCGGANKRCFQGTCVPCLVASDCPSLKACQADHTCSSTCSASIACNGGCCKKDLANGSTCQAGTADNLCGAGGDVFCTDCASNTQGHDCRATTGGGFCGCATSTECASSSRGHTCNTTTHKCGCVSNTECGSSDACAIANDALGLQKLCGSKCTSSCNTGACCNGTDCITGTTDSDCGNSGGACEQCSGGQHCCLKSDTCPMGFAPPGDPGTPGRVLGTFDCRTPT